MITVPIFEADRNIHDYPRLLSKTDSDKSNISWRCLRNGLAVYVLMLAGGLSAAETLPNDLRVVLDATQPVEASRNGRLPLYVLPISGSLQGVNDDVAEQALRELDQRAIGYSVEWRHTEFEASFREGLRIASIQKQLGQPVAVNANSCLYSFFDGSEDTLHVDADGSPGITSQRGAQSSTQVSLTAVLWLTMRSSTVRKESSIGERIRLMNRNSARRFTL